MYSNRQIHRQRKIIKRGRHTDRGLGLNTPPHLSLDREWILRESDSVGRIVTQLLVTDDDPGDKLSVHIGQPSYAISGRKNGSHFFKIDRDRVLLTKSVQGMAGETFFVGVIASDGNILNRMDVKVTIKKANDPAIRQFDYPRLPTSFDPGPPPPLYEIHGSHIVSNPGPPLVSMDPSTVWEMSQNASVGEDVVMIEATDLSNTYLKFELVDSPLLRIDENTGVITVAQSLIYQVGDHHSRINVSNEFDFIMEEATLRVVGTPLSTNAKSNNKLNATDVSTKNLVSTTPTADTSELMDIIKEGFMPNDEEQGRTNLGVIVVVVVMVLGVIPLLVVSGYLLWRYRERKRKSQMACMRSSIASLSEKRSAITPSHPPSTRKDSILDGIFSMVRLQRKTRANNYEENITLPKIPNRDFKVSSKFSKSNFFSEKKDKWEFPRQNLKVFGILGEGCFGQVWKCEATNMVEGGPIIVAVKTLKETASSAEQKDLMQELKVLKSLGSHPNVLSLLGCCTEREPIFVILEHMAGGKLLTYLRSSRTSAEAYGNLQKRSSTISPKELTIFACQVAKGMDFLSKNGIVHRDLAARNILVGEGKVCKVADFGFARDVDMNNVYERKSDGKLPIRWMAPESLFDNIFTVKSDVWSFGILLWEIVTLGSTPYPGMSASEVMRQIKDGYRLKKPDHCRREIYNVMYYCWNLKQSERPSFQELVQTLEALILSEVDYIQLDNFPEHDYYNFNSAPNSSELL